MRRAAAAAVVVAVLACAVAFAALNAGERVTVDLGIVVIYRVPLTLVVFGALLLGMLAMVVVSIDSDLRVRRILRDRLRAEDLEERRRMADPRQRDLFQEEDE